MDKIATMADLAISNSESVKAILIAISDLNQRFADYKHEFILQMQDIKYQLTNLDYKINLFIAVSVIGFSMLIYNMNAMNAKIDSLEAKFDSKFDALQGLLIQIILSRTIL